MSSTPYQEALAVCVPILGLCSAGIQLGTIRARFINATPVAPETPDWPLRKLFATLFLASEESKDSLENRELDTKKYTDLHRNFIENVAPFSMLALGVAVIVSEPSKCAVVAVQAFTACRVAHNLMYIFWNVQPYRALIFVPQLLAQGVLVAELLKHRNA